MNFFTSVLFLGLVFTAQGQTFTEIIKAAAVDRESEDRFGYAVDISGDYAIVGAYADDFGEFDPNMGSAYIFEKTGIEDWRFVQKIVNSDQDDYDRFGWSVAIDGDYAVIGAYGEDHDVDDGSSLSKAGSAYIFERNEEGVWEEVQKVVASDRAEGDEFGWSVDISGNTVIVGAHHEDEDEVGGEFIFRSGSVYAYERDAEGVWEEVQKIVAWDRQADAGGGDETMSVWHYVDIDYGDLFGCSISLSGDFMIVGAHNGDYNPDGVWGISQAGAAYIFTRADGTWVPDQKVCATNRGGWDRYGYSVAIDSNVAIVGAKAEDHSEFEADYMTNAGSAYIYTRDTEGEWSTVQKIDASDRSPGDHFGIEVDIDGDFLVVGAEAHNFDVDGEEEMDNAGKTYVFEKDEAGEWEEIQQLAASDRASFDLFADAVAISSHTILVGAWQQDLDSASMDYQEDAGAAYFFSSLLCTEEYYEQDIDLCAGDSLVVGPSVYTETGTYTDTLLNSDACDSIVTSHLFVAPITENEQSVSLCYGETYTIGASTYEVSGVYEDTLTAVTGCDSIVITTLAIADELITEQSFTICFGESITVGESVYTETGTYTDTFESVTLCDSTAITELTVIDAIDLGVEHDLFTLTANEPDAETTSFQWIKCDPYEVIPDANEQSYIAMEDGDYAVIIEKEACTDTTECTAVLGVGLDQNYLSNVAIFPNPANGQLTIRLDQEMSSSATVIIFDGLGKDVYRASLQNKTTEVTLDNLSKGMYILQVRYNDAIFQEQLILQ